MSTTGAAAPAASASGAATAYNGQRTTRRQQEEMDGSELPFLVTHWLRNFQASQGTAPEGSDSAASSGVSEEQRKAALGRIQRATSELASAFSALGVYGTASVVSSSMSTMPSNK